MEAIYDGGLIVHIATGFIALVVGAVSFASRKGGKLHRSSGKVYVVAMLLVAFSSFVLALIHYNPFLFMVGTFTLYMTITGYRRLVKKRKKTQKAKLADWLLIGISVVLAGYMTVRSVMKMTSESMGFLPVVLTFSGILLIFIVTDLLIYTGKRNMKANDWLLYHISRIAGAYIATFTAFLVTNVAFQPAFVVWLLPTVLGTPLIIYFRRKYRVKRLTKGSVA